MGDDYLNVTTAKTMTGYELQDQFIEELNKQYGTVNICDGVYDAGRALRWVDGERFRMQFAYWMHQEGWTKLHP